MGVSKVETPSDAGITVVGSKEGMKGRRVKDISEQPHRHLRRLETIPLPHLWSAQRRLLL
jgi:hypothetical protein